MGLLTLPPLKQFPDKIMQSNFWTKQFNFGHSAMYALKWIIQQKKKKISVAWYNEKTNKKVNFSRFFFKVLNQEKLKTMEIPNLVFVIGIYSSIPGALLRQSETSSATGKFYSSFFTGVKIQNKPILQNMFRKFFICAL